MKENEWRVGAWEKKLHEPGNSFLRFGRMQNKKSEHNFTLPNLE